MVGAGATGVGAGAGVGLGMATGMGTLFAFGVFEDTFGLATLGVAGDTASFTGNLAMSSSSTFMWFSYVLTLSSLIFSVFKNSTMSLALCNAARRGSLSNSS